ncbi:MAG: hypothetical protein OEO23_13145 [Gemmatimonadota bacterium]|nr:hypothetical protein [Gemmatimonadota bacterium]
MLTLGLSAFFHDSAAALMRDGEILAACQEERFSRRKHDAPFPALAVVSCLDMAGVRLDDVDQVVFFEKPFVDRLLETFLRIAPRGYRSFSKAMPLRITEKLFQKTGIQRGLLRLGRGEFRGSAGAFYWISWSSVIAYWSRASRTGRQQVGSRPLRDFFLTGSAPV